MSHCKAMLAFSMLNRDPCSQALPADKVEDLLERIEECLDWVTEHSESEEAHYKSRCEELETRAALVLPEIRQGGKYCSDHTQRKGILTAKYCLKNGDALVESGKEEDLYKSLEIYGQAYMLAREKGNKTHMMEADIKMGHIHRVLVEGKPNDVKTHLDLCTTAALRLSAELELDKGKPLSQHNRARAIDDFRFVVNEFFKKLSELGGTEKFQI